MPRIRFREATDLIQKALSGKFENDFTERTLKLIRSSNKSSFRDALCHMLTRTAEGLRLTEVGEAGSGQSDRRIENERSADRDGWQHLVLVTEAENLRRLSGR